MFSDKKGEIPRMTVKAAETRSFSSGFVQTLNKLAHWKRKIKSLLVSIFVHCLKFFAHLLKKGQFPVDGFSVI